MRESREFRAGEWGVEFTGPHPCWVRITYRDQEVHSVRHEDIADLQHCLDRARNAMRVALGQYGHEMD